MNLLFDTNILLNLGKGTRAQQILKIINPDNKKIFASVATMGELKSLVLQNNWGASRLQALDELLEDIVVVDINENMAGTYAEIDAYSQRRNPRIADYPFATPRNMGKNDLWIAATAALLGLKLVTTDADFNHLQNAFIEIQFIKPELLKV
ncbi:MAG TPA: PIN domain nuclease [Mucilaginibacter sp.]|jgi:tRNA(fMet)-specific endonuclease VapC|nr:PIN domain nuclease [Mucilaginibacter sp.]